MLFCQNTTTQDPIASQRPIFSFNQNKKRHPETDASFIIVTKGRSLFGLLACFNFSDEFFVHLDVVIVFGLLGFDNTHLGRSNRTLVVA